VRSLPADGGPEHGWTVDIRNGTAEWIPPPELDTGQPRVNAYHLPERLLKPTDDPDPPQSNAVQSPRMLSRNVLVRAAANFVGFAAASVAPVPWKTSPPASSVNPKTQPPLEF
jgi:hypothetical protein